MSKPSTFIIAITGPSSSGKTTLSKHILSILSPLLPAPAPGLLHQDDFYIPDSQLPTVKLSSGEVVANWDCEESLDIPRFARTLTSLQEHGKLPNDFESIQHLNDLNLPKSLVSTSLVQKHTEILQTALASLPPQTFIVILDGFLLLTPTILSQVRSSLQAVIMLRTTREQMIQRRAAREYATVEGANWADPPGYVEDVVWPGYVADHKFLFEGEDVSAKAKSEEDLERICGMNVLIAPAGELGGGGLEGLLDWGVEAFVDVLKSIGKKK